MLPMRLFRIRAFSAGNAAIFLHVRGAAVRRRLLHGAVPADRRSARGRSAPGCGCCPGRVALFLVAPIAGKLVDRVGERPLVVAGLLLQAIGLGWIALIAAPGAGLPGS